MACCWGGQAGRFWLWKYLYDCPAHTLDPRPGSTTELPCRHQPCMVRRLSAEPVNGVLRGQEAGCELVSSSSAALNTQIIINADTGLQLARACSWQRILGVSDRWREKQGT